MPTTRDLVPHHNTRRAGGAWALTYARIAVRAQVTRAVDTDSCNLSSTLSVHAMPAARATR